jgi:hypothetical protein
MMVKIAGSEVDPAESKTGSGGSSTEAPLLSG